MTIERIERKWFGGKPKSTELKPGHREVLLYNPESLSKEEIIIESPDSLTVRFMNPYAKLNTSQLSEEEQINFRRLQPSKMGISGIWGHTIAFRWKPSQEQQATK